MEAMAAGWPVASGEVLLVHWWRRGEERMKENFHQQNSFHHSKRHRSFNDQHLENGRNGKPQLGVANDRKVIRDRHGRERVFFITFVRCYTYIMRKVNNLPRLLRKSVWYELLW